MKRLDILVVAACLGLISLAVTAGPAAGGYHLLKKVSLGAAPGGGESFRGSCLPTGGTDTKFIWGNLTFLGERNRSRAWWDT